MSEACRLYFAIAPHAQAGILQRMPAMILNGYPRLLAAVRSLGSRSLSWPRPEVADEIRRSVTTPGFRALVDGVVEQILYTAA